MVQLRDTYCKPRTVNLGNLWHYVKLKLYLDHCERQRLPQEHLATYSTYVENRTKQGMLGGLLSSALYFQKIKMFWKIKRRQNLVILLYFTFINKHSIPDKRQRKFAGT